MPAKHLLAPDRQHPTCFYRTGVGCFPQDYRKACGKCGWNPEVAAQRTAKLMKRLNAEYEKQVGRY